MPPALSLWPLHPADQPRGHLHADRPRDERGMVILDEIGPTMRIYYIILDVVCKFFLKGMGIEFIFLSFDELGKVVFLFVCGEVGNSS